MNEELILTTPTGRLFGTLELPPSSNRASPIALIWSGSGPTDRDGNSHLGSRARSLRLLAEGLAKVGIASLRTDKRGVADSTAAGTSEEALTLQTYVDDAALWIDHLRSEARFGRVVAIGHSEGAGIMTRLAALRPLDGVVSLAGPGRRPSTVLREQLAHQVQIGRMPATLHELALSYIETLERGERVEAVDPQLSFLFRPSVQPFLISTFQFDPQSAARRLRAPLLIVQGTADTQIAVLDAEALRLAQPTSKLLLVPGMNHILKAAPLDPEASAVQRLDPTVPLADGVIEGVAAFIQSGLVP